MKSTNMLERYHEELRRRTRVVRIFPNAESCLRLILALAAETHERWLTGQRYLYGRVSAPTGNCRRFLTQLLKLLKKNQGYGLEHHYGHGHRYLANTLATLMMLAFLVDQIQQLCCPRFQAARRRQGSYASLWEKMRGAIWLLVLHSWEQLYEVLAGVEPDRGSGRPDLGSRPP